MSRTKSHSSKIARLRDLLNNAMAELDSIQTDYEDMAQDSARLKEIEPALLKLQNAINPPAASTLPAETPTGYAPATEQIISGQPDKPKHKRARKGAPANDSTGETPAIE